MYSITPCICCISVSIQLSSLVSQLEIVDFMEFIAFFTPSTIVPKNSIALLKALDILFPISASQPDTVSVTQLAIKSNTSAGALSPSPSSADPSHSGFGFPSGRYSTSGVQTQPSVDDHWQPILFLIPLVLQHQIPFRFLFY